jgi:hypothetical protein
MSFHQTARAGLWVLTGVLCIPLPHAAAGWEPTTTELIAREKPGYGKLCGVAVDHRTGDVYVDLSDRGIYRSTDQGKSWERRSGELKGRTEWPGCLMLDPLGKSERMVVALVYGSPIVVSPDRGKTWKVMDGKSGHVDWCAADWADPDLKFVLALKHESGGLLIASRDGGKTFAEVGKGYGPAWVFDGETAVVAELATKDRPRPGLLRTTDGARTFQPCAAYSARALPKMHDGTLYWLVDGAILTTADKGATWKKLCDLKGGFYGPIFGKDARHLFVLTGAGIVESTDGGASWSKPIALPGELKGVGVLSWMEYDPRHDILYAMKMGSELYKLVREK